MIKDKCCREINDSLQRTFAKSVLHTFAANLDINIVNDGKRAAPTIIKDKEKDEEELERKSSYGSEEESSQNEAEDEKAAQFKKYQQATDNEDIKMQAKILKSFSTTTPQDMEIHKRQKNGQLRFGDVICLTYHDDVYLDEDAGKAPGVEAEPIFKYKGLLYSDGVTDKGMKMIPQTSYNSQNASTLFKQCLFRIEVVQDCEVNKRAINLNNQRKNLEDTLKKMIKDAQGEQNVEPLKLSSIKKEIEQTINDIIENDEKLVVQEDNNRYNQEYRDGTKLTYGTPLQLKHLFSGRYLALNLHEMSQEYGSCELALTEPSEDCQFVIHPAQDVQNTSGYVVNFQDYFCIKSVNSSTPFNIHITEKVNNSNPMQKGFLINASIQSSALKAKLFMSYKEQKLAKDFIQSGDVIRLKHSTSGGYLSTSSLFVDDLLPDVPDFLKGQIKRTYENITPIEQPIGGKDMSESEKLKAKQIKQDFKIEMINDNYVKKLKEKSHETIFIEMNKNRTKFTNSSWEIQRVNPLNGGNIIQEEVVRFKHVGTGKFLSLDKQNGITLTLSNTNYDLETLFLIKSDMSNKTKARFLDDDGDGVADDVKLLHGNQRIIIQSYYTEKYLQLYEDIEQEIEQSKAQNIDEDNTQITFKQEDPEDSRYNLVCHEFMKLGKQKMVFIIEEVNQARAIKSYQASCIFDELLEYYCFMNQYGVAEVEHEDSQEKFFLKPQKAKKVKHILENKTQVMQFIIENLNTIIDDPTTSSTTEEKSKMKEEISDQGILDILLCIVEIIYYKATPPMLFNAPFFKKRSNQDGKIDQRLETQMIKAVQENQAQQITREITHDLLLEILYTVLKLVHNQKNNSEKVTKYFGVLYQVFTIKQTYENLEHFSQNKITAFNPRKFKIVLGLIFNNAQRDAIYVIKDRSIYSLMKHRDDVIKAKKKQIHDEHTVIPQLVELKTINPPLVNNFAVLLNTVRYTNKYSQNLETQCMCLQVLQSYCVDTNDRGVYPYQKQISNFIFESEYKHMIKFGTAKVDGTLRPYVYFVRPENMSLQEFKQRNPLLDEIHNTENMQQHNNQKQKCDLIFDLHEMTKIYDKAKPYIDYICQVVNLYASLCLSSNEEAIQLMKDTGLSDSHISLCINQDKDTLIIHETLKTAYMFLARTMFIENDPIFSSIENKNRCYVWERISKTKERKVNQVEENYFEDLVQDDQYAGKTKKKFTSEDDVNNSMILLTAEQDSQNMQVILLLQRSILWFLKHGPTGTIGFFAHNQKKNFAPDSIQDKLNAISVYLDAIYSLIQRDLIDQSFIDQTTYICLAIQFGALQVSQEREKRVPFVIQSNWLYQLLWISKYIVSTSKVVQIEDYNKRIECRALDILNKISYFRLNQQLKDYLSNFRSFEEQVFEPNQDLDQDYALEKNFDEIFKRQSIFSLPCIDEIKFQKEEQIQKHRSQCQQQKICTAQQMLTGIDQEFDKEVFETIEFEFFLDYIFDDGTRIEVREKAIEMLILSFNQKDMLAKELIATNIIVTDNDYETFIYFISKQRCLKQAIYKMIQNETSQEIFNEKPSQQTKQIKNQIISIIKDLTTKLNSFQNLQQKRIQNMIVNINMIDEIMNQLLKKLVDKMFFYRDLFQNCVDFFFAVCIGNSLSQKVILKDITFFIDMINQRIESGQLISELIKAQIDDSETSSNFINYLIGKIVKEGYFKTPLLKLLIKLAKNESGAEDGDVPRSLNENENQQEILKQMISNPKFRSLILMKPQFTSTKIGTIKAYFKKLQLHNDQGKEREFDTGLLRDREALNLHLSCIDLLAACAKNNSYGVTQAQQIISIDELLDSILSDAIPYAVKQHYFNLLYEIYLRKVEGIDVSGRLSLTNPKFQQVLERVIERDLDYSFHYYEGLIAKIVTKSTEENKAYRTCIRQVQNEIQKEMENRAILSIQRNNQIEQGENVDQNLTETPTLSLGWDDATPILMLDEQNLFEFWQYLYESNDDSSNSLGLLGFIEHFYTSYDKKDLGDDAVLQKISFGLKEKLLNLANKILFFIDQFSQFMKEDDCQQLLNNINRAILQIPNTMYHENQKENEEMQTISKRLDNRMCGDKLIKIVSQYCRQKNISIRKALDIQEKISSEDHMVDRYQLKHNFIKVVQNQANYDEIEKALQYFQLISIERKQTEAGAIGYMVEDEFDAKMIDLVDIEVKIRECLEKQGYILDMQDESQNQGNGKKSKDYSVTVNIDLSLYSQRFLEFLNSNKHHIEIHDFVDKLMRSSFAKDRYAKLQLVKDLIKSFPSLRGVEGADLVLISVLSLIIQRYIPEELDSQQTASLTLLGMKKKNKINDRLSEELKQWQDIMFEAEVPELILSFINVSSSPYLANNALQLINKLLFDPQEDRQRKILNILKTNDQFFDVFYYINQRFDISKKIILKSIQNSAEEKFKAESLYFSTENKSKIFNDEDWFLDKKYDLNEKYMIFYNNWQSEEMNILLQFLNSLCENCFNDAQLFLKKQVDDQENFKVQKKITSIDLIYQVVMCFTDIVETVGDYVFSDYRTFAMLPLIIDTLQEFIYGPCIENQIFLGESKKFISVINSLMDQLENGNFSGIHQQAKAQLKILYACSQLLLAIVDIKDPEKAKFIHNIMLDQLDIENLVLKMTQIYSFRVGGDPQRKLIYEFNKMCTHLKINNEDPSRCIQDEFCEFKNLIPRDHDTIQTGFNIYLILQMLRNSNPNHRAIQCFKRDEGGFSFLKKTEGDHLKRLIYHQYKLSSEKTLSVYNRFNKIEVKLLDQLIIRIYPELYIAYLEKVLELQKVHDMVDYMLQEKLEEVKTAKSMFDRLRILEKLPQILRCNYLKQRKAKGPQSVIYDYGQIQSYKEDVNDVHIVELQQRFAKVDIDNVEVPKISEPNDDEALRRKIKMYEFHLAGNFYEDNIGNCEIQRETNGENKEELGELVETTFKMPSYCKHLTIQTREKIPYLMTKVSQQEKLEFFVEIIEKLEVEMKWQQSLGKTSPFIKKWSNQWEFLSYLNFSVICVINFSYVLLLKINEQAQGNQSQFMMDQSWQMQASIYMSYFQTLIALIVVFAYYLDTRSALKYDILANRIQKLDKIEGYGLNQGSFGYGRQKAHKFININTESNATDQAMDKVAKSGFVFQILNLLIKELIIFIKAIGNKDHARNIWYFFVSLFSNQNTDGAYLCVVVLMLDVLFKIPTLRLITEILGDQKYSLISVLALFIVVLYIFAFIGFQSYKEDFQHSDPTSDDDTIYHQNPYQVYCESLILCFTSTAQYGIRSGGGIGDALNNPTFGYDQHFLGRYLYDFLFFMILNIILMNIFFGIIIDAFAEKRAATEEIKQEVTERCFICGISRSQFEIKNVNWLNHIYCVHNLHSYVAFIIYVKQKNQSECTGVEKWCKTCIEKGTIEFFPIARTALVDGGQKVEDAGED